MHIIYNLRSVWADFKNISSSNIFSYAHLLYRALHFTQTAQTLKTFYTIVLRYFPKDDVCDICLLMSHWMRQPLNHAFFCGNMVHGSHLNVMDGQLH